MYLGAARVDDILRGTKISVQAVGHAFPCTGSDVHEDAGRSVGNPLGIGLFEVEEEGLDLGWLENLWQTADDLTPLDLGRGML
ncbi:MAG: hypothetical protein QM691_00555 [Opitutaceae bacterium]